MSTGPDQYSESSFKTNEYALDDLTDNDLVQTVEALRQENWQLTLENDCFEKFLRRVDPTSLDGLVQFLDQATKTTVPTTSAGGSVQQLSDTERLSIKRSSISETSEVGRRRSSLSGGPRQSVTLSLSLLERGPRVNVSQKTEIVDKEIEELKVVYQELLTKTAAKKASLKAQTEEIDIRTAETRESRDNFEKSVVQEGVDVLTQRIPAEKFVYFMEEWLKNVGSVTEKLRLRTGTMRSQYIRLHHQFALKEELGETLRPIDFEQLTIENKDHMNTIEEKNTHLFGLKKVTGIASLTLSIQKKNLIEAIKNLRILNTTIHDTKQLIVDMEIEEEEAQQEVIKAQEELDKLREVTTEFSAPGVMDYVKKKAELYKLEDQIKIWTRKRNMQRIALNSMLKSRK